MAYHGHNQRADFRGNKQKPIGVITRGTTGVNRLRKCDRWVFYTPTLHATLRQPGALALDVGYGASYTTTVEWARWLRKINPSIKVTGLEIDPARVLPPRDGVTFELGGFELGGYRPQLVRAFNVLRQYDVDQVHDAWTTVCTRLADDGMFIEGTCDEQGKRATWIFLNRQGPQSLTLAWNPWELNRPSEIAERLPKILIHRNVPGEAIHSFLIEADRCWDRASSYEAFGPRVRWFHAHSLLRNFYPVSRPRLRRDNLVTIPWELIAPGD